MYSIWESVFCFFFFTFLQEIWSLDKEVRVWDAYAGLEGMVKDMMTSLRAVAELQSPALRDRHWHQLMKAVGVSFPGLISRMFL